MNVAETADPDIHLVETVWLCLMEACFISNFILKMNSSHKYLLTFI